MGLVFGLGLVPEEANILPNSFFFFFFFFWHVMVSFMCLSTLDVNIGLCLTLISID
jgi:hypothetical protein